MFFNNAVIKENGFETISLISESRFSQVYLAKSLVTNLKVVIKITDIERSNGSIRFIREMALFKRMDHPLIASLYHWFEDGRFLYLVMEYLPSGSILDYINKKGPVPESFGKKIFTQFVLILEYLHKEQFICHRDIKAENVLFDLNYNVRLIDFGLSTEFNESSPTLYTACGSPAYVAPEIILQKGYTKSADIWSAGILLFAIMSGYLPFDSKDSSEIPNLIINEKLIFPSYFSQNLKQLLNGMLDKDPNTRFTLNQIKNHLWFSNIEFKRIEKIRNLFDNIFNLNYKIDEKILNILKNYSIDIENLSQSLFLQEFDECSVLYRLFRREKINEILFNLEIENNINIINNNNSKINSTSSELNDFFKLNNKSPKKKINLPCNSFLNNSPNRLISPMKMVF